MGEITKIGWTDHTFNGWIGCTEVQPGCDNCYARVLNNRMGWVTWGAGQPRRRTVPANWRQPLKWDRQACEAGVMAKTFAFSLADVFDTEVPEEWRLDFFTLMRKTAFTYWQLVTKRPAVARQYFDTDLIPWGRTWLIVSVDHNKYLYKAEQIADAPAIVKGISWEPALRPLDVTRLPRAITWLIIGGESRQAGQCRPFDLEWVRQALARRPKHLKVFVKQLGGNILDSGAPLDFDGKRDGHNADPSLWPEWLNVQEFPI